MLVRVDPTEAMANRMFKTTLRRAAVAYLLLALWQL